MDYIYDVEFYKNFFCVNFKSFDGRDERFTFEISSRKDERESLLAFLKQQGLRLIGFNNVGYDYPVLHMLIKSPNISLERWWNRVQQEVFNNRTIVWDRDREIFQIDLFKINHYDNRARMVSLKYLEFTQRWYKVQDLPLDPKQEVPIDKMDSLVEYCWNDVDFTHEFAKTCINAIHFRERMSKLLGKNVMDFSDVKIGEYLNQLNYEKITGKKWTEFKNLRTERKIFNMSDIIPNNVDFQTPFMKKFLEDLRGLSFKEWDKNFKFDIVIENGKFREVVKGGISSPSRISSEQFQLNTIITFAKGGLHTVDMPRVVKRKQGWRLQEKDVGSMYPKFIIENKVFPQHLGEQWNQSIENAYNYRIDTLKPKLKELEYGSPEWQEVEDEQQVYKLAMNGGGFGKLGSKFSWQYDPLAKFKVTMGCELCLLMLIEQFLLHDIEVVSVNTDGVVIHYKNDKQAVVDRIHRDWEKKTEFLLEDTDYDKIVFSSVNDYIAVIIDPTTGKKTKVKYKGDFEINKDPHKNNSQRIVPIVLSEYFTKDNVDIKEIISTLGYEFIDDKGNKETTSIYDYCIGRKSNSTCHYALIKNGIGEKLDDKVIRYYISNSNEQLLKVFTGGKKQGEISKVNAGFNVTMFMEFFLRKNYDINISYYVNECMKIIKPIEKGTRVLEQGKTVQTSLF